VVLNVMSQAVPAPRHGRVVHMVKPDMQVVPAEHHIQQHTAWLQSYATSARDGSESAYSDLSTAKIRGCWLVGYKKLDKIVLSSPLSPKQKHIFLTPHRGLPWQSRHGI
jgi:hypothetical protein